MRLRLRECPPEFPLRRRVSRRGLRADQNVEILRVRNHPCQLRRRGGDYTSLEIRVIELKGMIESSIQAGLTDRVTGHLLTLEGLEMDRQTVTRTSIGVSLMRHCTSQRRKEPLLVRFGYLFSRLAFDSPRHQGHHPTPHRRGGDVDPCFSIRHDW